MTRQTTRPNPAADPGNAEKVGTMTKAAATARAKREAALRQLDDRGGWLGHAYYATAEYWVAARVAQLTGEAA